MKKYFFILVLFIMYSCSNRYVEYFKDTPAYELAKAVNSGNLNKIERIVKKNPELLEYNEPNFGINVLNLAIDIGNYQSFKKLLELGANPNSINPKTKTTPLIESATYFDGYNYDLRYMQLLLDYGADPNYAVDEEIIDEYGVNQEPITPLMKASTLSFDMVKLLLKYGADPYRKVGRHKTSAFRSSFMGNPDREVIINYYIDTLKVDVKEPFFIRDNGDTLYIQDYVNRFIHDESRERIIRKLEGMGVDFENYDYK